MEMRLILQMMGNREVFTGNSLDEAIELCYNNSASKEEISWQ